MLALKNKDETQCKECGQREGFYITNTRGWYWGRCARCGAHTSSYTTQDKAIKAVRSGEHGADKQAIIKGKKK